MQTISREIQIDYGHTLPDHFGFCNQIHGHRARIVAHFSGDIKTDGSERGMVIDFGVCKKAMMQRVHNVLDHGFAIWKDDTKELMVYSNLAALGLEKQGISYPIKDAHKYQPYNVSTLQFIMRRNKKYLICDEPPTSEYLAKWAFYEIVNGLKELKRDDVYLVKLDWWETPNNCATYKAGVEKT